MADAMKKHFVGMFEYQARCVPLVLESLYASKEKVREVGLASLVAPYERAVEIFCHLQAAKRLWLSRVSKLTEFPPDGVFPVWPLEKAAREAQEVDALWQRFARELNDDQLAGIVRYESTEGVGYESILADILTHVVNHSTYHRGQIAMLVAQTGVRPAVTDYIALTRRKLGE